MADTSVPATVLPVNDTAPKEDVVMDDAPSASNGMFLALLDILT
jgi:hypothetical protein